MVEFTIDELTRLLYTLAGGEEEAPFNLGDDIADMDFVDIGIDSLTLFNTLHRIQRDYDIELPDEVVIELSTPRELLDEVAKQLSRVS
jgi:act minimal PKS acyl carrier protein